MFSTKDEKERLTFNGINGDRGEYDLPPMAATELLDVIAGRKQPEKLSELRDRYRERQGRVFAVRAGVDPGKMAEAGWGVIFPRGADPAIQEALCYALEHTLDPAAIDDDLIFEVNNEISGQTGAGVAEAEQIAACEEAARLAAELGFLGYAEAACLSARDSQAAALAVLPACERYVSVAAGDVDLEGLLMLCSLVGTTGYEEIGAVACSEITANAIQQNVTISGDIVEPDAGEYWAFSGEEGETIAVRMEKAGSELDSVVTILSADGRPLAEDDQSGGDNDAWISSFTLPETRTYYIRASGWSNSTGAYELTVTAVGE